MKTKLFFGFACTLFSMLLKAQVQTANKIKFGDITAKDFQQKTYSIDKDAQAVVLYDAGSAEYNSEMTVTYRYHRIVRLLNNNAFSLATVEIPLFKGERGGDQLQNFRAVTYNYDNSAVQTKKLEKESIFDDKVTKGIIVRKFTFPDLKEGCIIEYAYDIISRNPNYIRSWTFQESIPVLQSRYEVTAPNFLNFITLKKGYYDLTPVTDEETRLYTGGGFNSGFNGITTHSVWTLKDLPSMKREKFTTSVDNYMSSISFQLKSVQIGTQQPIEYTTSWGQKTEAMLKYADFGRDLKEKNGFMSDDLKKLVVVGKQEETAQNIFNFVRDNFTCTDHTAIFLTEDLKTAYQSKKGNVADINLVLTAMLKKAGISADPVILSTRENGVAYDLYPIMSKYNYLVADAFINDRQYLLDASLKKTKFDHLPSYCYNGFGHMISEEGPMIELNPDSVLETKTTSILIKNSADGKIMEGSFNTDLGYYDSYELREKLEKENTDDYFKAVKAGFSGDVSIMNTTIDPVKDLNENITVHYDFDIAAKEDIIYFNPMLSEAMKANPFKASNRNYPVEMPYKTNESIILNMEIPKGYKVDELPKSEKIDLNNDEANFEYIVQANATSVQVRCRIKVNKTMFEPADYNSLRDFYEQIVKKQSEQIVFKKL